jgi:hypothetical protein
MNGDRADAEGSGDPGAEIDMPGEIDHADPRVADGVGFGMYGTAGVNTGAAVRPDPTRPHMRESPSPDPRLTPRPRVLAPAAAHEGPARPPQVALRTQEVVS